MPELERLLSALAKASRVTKYYPPGHPQIEETLGRVLGQIAALVSKGSAVTLAVHDDGLYVGATRVLRFDASEGLFHNLNDLGVSELVLSPGLNQEELLHFVEAVGREPKRTWEEGGLPRGLKQRKVTHIGVTARDLTAAERLATLDSLRTMSDEERAEALSATKRWIDGGEPAPSNAEVIRIIAVLRDAGGIREIMQAPGPEGHDKGRVSGLVRLWTVVAKAGLDVPEIEAAMASDFLATDPGTLLDVADDEQVGISLVQKLLERLDPSVVADLIADRVKASAADAAGWIPVVHALFRRPGTRRSILYRMLQQIRERADAAESVAALEEDLAEGTREESAFLALMRGALVGSGGAPSSWSGRWGSGVLVRRATGVLERAGLAEVARVEWLSRELDRLIQEQDVEGVLEVLEVVRDRRAQPEGGAETPSVVSHDAHLNLPSFLSFVGTAERVRMIRALTSVDRLWRELIGRFLDLVAVDELRLRTGELEAAGIVPRDLVLDLMRSENPEEIARGIRIASVLACPEDPPILLGFLQHGNHSVRTEAIRALASVAPGELLAQSPLILRDPNPLVAMSFVDVAVALPEAAARFVDASKAGVLRTLPEEIGLAVVDFVAQHGTEEQKKEVAAAVLAPRIVGRQVPDAVRDAVRRFVGDDGPRGIKRLFKPRSRQGTSDA
jgi:hypothetical protein